jgi:hypothetical protein
MSAKVKIENGGLGARKESSETDTVDVASLLVDDDEDPSGSGQWSGRSIRTPLPLFPAKATLHIYSTSQSYNTDSPGKSTRL